LGAPWGIRGSSAALVTPKRCAWAVRPSSNPTSGSTVPQIKFTRGEALALVVGLIVVASLVFLFLAVIEG